MLSLRHGLFPARRHNPPRSSVWMYPCLCMRLSVDHCRCALPVLRLRHCLFRARGHNHPRSTSHDFTNHKSCIVPFNLRHTMLDSAHVPASLFFFFQVTRFWVIAVFGVKMLPACMFVPLARETPPYETDRGLNLVLSLARPPDNDV